MQNAEYIWITQTKGRLSWVHGWVGHSLKQEHATRLASGQLPGVADESSETRPCVSHTSVGAPLAGMNDLNLGIHLHKHTKQPTLLKTSLNYFVNYFVINHNLARSPDSM